MVMVIVAFQIALAHAAEANDRQPIEAIRTAAREFLLRQNESRPESTQVTVGALDERLRLSRCEQPLEAFAPPGSKSVGRVTVGVRCGGPRRWSLYVPASVQWLADVVVAKRDLPRGTRVDRSDIALERHDLGRLHRGYFLSTDEVLGKIAARTVRRGKPLDAALLDAPLAVRRGSTVDIVANVGGVVARMRGKALDRGSLGETIRVESASSGRELEARIVSGGKVEVDI
jgi:flagella basal body P-ring formation protein FlgA